MSSWPRTDISANRYINTYFKGFVDISGGNLNIRNNNKIDISGVEIGSSGTQVINVPELDASLGLNVANGSFTINSAGVTTMTSKLTVNNTIRVTDISCANEIIAASDIKSLSDVTLKDNVYIIEDALEKVSNIRGVSFTRNDLEDTQQVHFGVIAQEVEAIFPQLVSGEKIKSVAYSNMIAPLIEAIKELKYQNEGLITRVSNLEKKSIE
jgi:hypothetical protein